MFITLRRFFILFCLALPLAAAAAAPTVAAGSYILMDAETGTVLAEENADVQLPPASLTKIMSTYLYFQAIKDGVLQLDQQVTISENAWGSNVAGSKMFLEVGTEVSVEDLLRGVIIQSGNDSSIALAEAIAGDEQLFAQQMNDAAAAMKLANSYFSNATGLPHKQHYSSARDMAILVRHTVRDFPTLYQLYQEQHFTYNNIYQENRNYLLKKFSGADGVKTGYTKKAGYCLAASAVRNGRRLIAVIMKTDSVRVREKEASKLLTYGFNSFRNSRLFHQSDSRTLPLWFGVREQITVQPAKDGVYTLPRQARTALQYTPQTNIRAPIAKGDVLGELQVLVDDEPYDRIDVVAAEAVAAGDWWKQLKDEIKLEWLGHGNSKAVFSQW